MALENMRYLCRWVWPGDDSNQNHFVMAYLPLLSPDIVCFQVFTRADNVSTPGVEEDRLKVEPDNYQTVSDLSDEDVILRWKGKSGEMLLSIPRPWFGKVAELAIIAIAGQFRP